MNKSLLDTDILSEVFKARNATISHRQREYRAIWGMLSLSVVSVMEIMRGLWRSGDPGKLVTYKRCLESEEVISFTTEVALLAGKMEAELLLRGIRIGMADTMIAATAIEHGLVLVTGNIEHFQRLQQLGFPLRLANWRESDS
jgi:predicted nucleic acid-binding protein